VRLQIKILGLLVFSLLGLSILYSYETKQNDGLLYHLELSDPSTYNVSCYEQLSSKWKVSNNFCSLETSVIEIPGENDSANLDIPLKINIGSSGNLENEDFAHIQIFAENKWLTVDSIYGNNIPKTPTSFNYYIRQIKSGEHIKIRLSFQTDDESEYIELYNKNAGDFSVGSPLISGTNIHYVYNTLPINLLSFTGRVLNGDVLIEWVTGYEYDNKCFILEKSYNGIDFESVNKISGLKYSNKKHSYKVYDELSDSNKHVFYRLKQTDLYNRSLYYDIIYLDSEQLHSEKNECKNNVYPDPCLGKCEIDLETCPDSVEILNFYTLDALGNITINKISKSLLDSSTFTSFDVENNFKPGIYILRLNDKDTSNSKL